MTEPLVVGAFTDETLDPRRCVRRYADPFKDGDRSLIRGDELLVDTTPYGVPGLHWCAFAHSAPGSAAVYPYKVKVPGRGEGQYAAWEVRGWRRPLAFHRTMMELRTMRAHIAEPMPDPIPGDAASV